MLPVVFVVDDEINIARSLAAILSRSGFDAVAYTDPHIALAQADLRSPCVLITDLLMPQMSGMDLAASFARSYPQCKVIVLSGQIAESPELRELALDEERIRVLMKPVSPPELIRHTREMSA